MLFSHLPSLPCCTSVAQVPMAGMELSTSSWQTGLLERSTLCQSPPWYVMSIGCITDLQLITDLHHQSPLPLGPLSLGTVSTAVRCLHLCPAKQKWRQDKATAEHCRKALGTHTNPVRHQLSALLQFATPWQKCPADPIKPCLSPAASATS